MSKFYHFGKIFKTNVIEGPSQKIVSGPVNIEIFKGTRSYKIPLPLASVVPKEEDTLVAKSAELSLDKEGYHIELTARTKEKNPVLARKLCEDEIDRIITIISIIHTPDIFRKPFYSGWVWKELAMIDVWVKLSERIRVDEKQLYEKLEEIKRNQSSDQDVLDRFKLMSRFFTKSLTYNPSEEKFLLLWTILEIYPMKNETDIKPISKYLADITGKQPDSIKAKLGIGRLNGIRGDLVHKGKWNLNIKEQGELFTKLEKIVLEILRTMSGLNYSGSLDKYL